MQAQTARQQVTPTTTSNPRKIELFAFDLREPEFKLDDQFVSRFADQQPSWGPVGYVTYKRCVDVSTPVLCADFRWRPAGELQEGDEIVAFDPERDGRRLRHIRLGRVMHNKVEQADTYGIELEDGSVLYATPDHEWLVKMSSNRLVWRETKDLAESNKGGPVYLCRPLGPMWKSDDDYDSGYLAAAFDGEGCLDRVNSAAFIQVGNDMLERVEAMLDRRGVPYTKSEKKPVEGRQQVYSLRITGRRNFIPLLGAIQAPRLLAKLRQNIERDGGALRTDPEDLVRVVRVFPAGERSIAVLSTDVETHFTGGFASHNTYARTKPDGTSEEYWETVQRVVEGTYRIQQRHCQWVGTTWDADKAQRSAQTMFQLMWDFKFLPPGRGLWMMGTPFIEQRGAAALNNPLHVDTPVLTKEHGWVPLGSLAGQQDVTLLSSIKLYGRDHTSTAASPTWVKASVSETETQPTKRVVVRDNSGFMTEIIASENHRWYRRRTVKHQWERVTTVDLREGDQFPLTMPAKNAPVSMFGAQHGLFFGDGTRSNGELDSSIAVLRDLFGDRAENVAHRREDEWVVRNCPRHWSTVPADLTDTSYIYGFLAGYFATDGYVDTNGTCSLSSSRRDELQEVARLFQSVGVRTSPLRLSSDASNYSAKRELWSVHIHNHDLWDAFFLKTQHQDRWRRRGDAPTSKYAKVIHIEDAGMQPVLCATVPAYEQFVVDGFILTSNCAFTSTEDIASNFSRPFTFLMDMSMLGVGVGGDTRGAGTVTVQEPTVRAGYVWVIPDTREGWVEAVGRLLDAYVGQCWLPERWDYSRIRDAGAPIVGFGGTAGGPDDLQRLLEKDIPSVLDRLKGQLITEAAIVDLFNYIGKCVVAGSVRRSAEIMFGSGTDFMDLKNPNTNAAALRDRRWASNNSIFAHVGMDYSEAAQRTAMNGEPGYLWLDNVRDYGRMVDPINGHDRRVVGANPCVTGDTWVVTDKGPARVTDLLGSFRTVLINGAAHKTTRSGFFKTGTRPIYRLRTQEGHTLRLTADHKVLTPGDQWVEAGVLQPGDKVCLNNTRGVNWHGAGTLEEGWLIGSLLGDGHIHQPNNQAATCKLQFWGATKDSMLEVALTAIKTLGGDSRYHSQRTGTTVEDRNMVSVQSRQLWERLRLFGIDQTTKDITSEYELLRSSSSFYAGFLRGIFDADGSVQGTQRKGVSVRLSSTNQQYLRIAQQMLLALGVNSTLYSDRQLERVVLLPDGKGGEAEYTCKALHELVVARDNLFEYATRVGFADPVKRQALIDRLEAYKRRPNRETFEARVTSVEYDGVEDVYDCTVPDLHRFGANGFIVHNCMEQSLEDHELCCLVETFPAHHDSYKEYEETLKYAYLYAKTVTLVPTHNPHTNAVMMRNRRIGTSQSGIVQSFAKHGRRTHFEWCSDGYEFLRRLDDEYSDWMCIRRSIKVTSVKPSGTVSKLCGATSGIHYPPAEYYIQRIRFASDSPMLRPLSRAGYPMELSVNGDSTMVVEFPVRTENFTKGEADASMWEQLANAAAMQKYWADNQVSCTVKFDNSDLESATADIKAALELYEDQLKGISFLPHAHGYAQAPWEPISEAEYARRVARIRKLDLIGDTHDTDDKFCDGEACQL